MVSWLLNPTDRTGALSDVKHPPELPPQGKTRWSVVSRAICLRMDFVMKAPPVIRERPLRTQQKVRGKSEAEPNQVAQGVPRVYRRASDVQG